MDKYIVKVSTPEGYKQTIMSADEIRVAGGIMPTGVLSMLVPITALGANTDWIIAERIGVGHDTYLGTG